MYRYNLFKAKNEDNLVKAELLLFAIVKGGRAYNNTSLF